MVKAVCATPIPYFSISTVFSVCLKHGHIPALMSFARIARRKTPRKLRRRIRILWLTPRNTNTTQKERLR